MAGIRRDRRNCSMCGRDSTATAGSRRGKRKCGYREGRRGGGGETGIVEPGGAAGAARAGRTGGGGHPKGTGPIRGTDDEEGRPAVCGSPCAGGGAHAEGYSAAAFQFARAGEDRERFRG